MKPCISQATTMSTPLEADLPAFQRGGWRAVELWLTKLETYLEGHTIDELRGLLDSHDLVPAAAAGQGGLLLSRGDEREIHKSSGFCASLDTTLALIAQCGSNHAGVCLDLFHYYTGPSKFEDLAYLSRDNLAWVQVCDLSGTPRELAGDRDRILPGEGDFQIDPILDHVGRIGYDGYVSLEVLNPQLWQVPADRVADLGHQAVCRVLGQWNRYPPETWGGA